MSEVFFFFGGATWVGRSAIGPFVNHHQEHSQRRKALELWIRLRGQVPVVHRHNQSIRYVCIQGCVRLA